MQSRHFHGVLIIESREPAWMRETRCGRALSTGLLVITYKPPALGVKTDLGSVMVFEL